MYLLTCFCLPILVHNFFGLSRFFTFYFTFSHSLFLSLICLRCSVYLVIYPFESRMTHVPCPSVHLAPPVASNRFLSALFAFMFFVSLSSCFSYVLYVGRRCTTYAWQPNCITCSCFECILRRCMSSTSNAVRLVILLLVSRSL